MPAEALTVDALLKNLDEVKPNAFNKASKLLWLNEIEGKVQTDILLNMEDIVQYGEGDGASVLLVPAPFCKLYLPYMEARVDFENGEYDRYQNSITLANAFYEEFKRWFALRYRGWKK